MVKRNVDISGLPESSRRDLRDAPEELKAHANGVAGDVLLEPIPSYIRSKCETVYHGQNNSFIVFGRDRPASRLSGYGGLGDTQCGSIDIVVGRMSSNPKSDAWVDPDFKKDAARIVISQKTDIDKNFSITSGKVGMSSAKSGVGIKADAVRIVAREGIKLVTGTDRENSQGGVVDTTLGIDIIAGNDTTTLQPMVKGQNLSAALEGMVKQIENLSGIVSAFVVAQQKLNGVLTAHTHISPFFGSPTTPSEVLGSVGPEVSATLLQDVVIGIQKHKTNLVAYKNNYLRATGKKYINSRHNSVN